MLTVSTALTAQTVRDTRDTTVERVYGAQIGLLGVWGYGEFPLGDEVALRTEIGIDAGIRGSSLLYDPVFVLTPSVRLEPRWYYNLAQRAAQGRNTGNNAANYFSVPLIAHPGLFRIASEDFIGVDRSIKILPTWGIRRNLGDRLNYEIGIGYGYGLRWGEGRSRPSGGDTGWLHLRIGI